MLGVPVLVGSCAYANRGGRRLEGFARAEAAWREKFYGVMDDRHPGRPGN